MTRPPPRLALAALLAWSGGVAFSAPAAGELSFNAHIQPVLSEYCYHCHGPDAGTRMPKETPLRLDRAEFAFLPRENGKPALVKGDPAASSVVARIRAASESEIMPPPSSHKTMKPEEIALIERWIREGAEFEEHWSLLPPKRPPVPAAPAALASWVRTPVDAFVAARLHAGGLAPNTDEDRVRLLRRVFLDLTGLPPAPDEVKAFLADTSPDAYGNAVDRLLASPRYGEHMARHWLDAARYADTHGVHIDNYRAIWPYRDWVIQAFNANVPFDRFTIEQIAGDLLPDATLDQRIATGFNRCLPTTGEGGAIAEEYDAIYAKDRVETTAGVWLGLTMGCAACHDHKFDPVTMRDFYSFAAFFRNTPMSALDGNNAEHPPNVFVPAAADRTRWDALPAEIATARAAVGKRKSEARPDFEKWLAQGPATVPEPSPSGLHLHLPFHDADAVARGSLDGTPREWPAALPRADGPLGPAPVFGNGATLEIGEAGDVERTDAFSFGAHVRLEGAPSGALVARMDPGNAFRGWDLWLEEGRLGTHILHSWPDDALKVVTKKKLEPGRWVHVMVVYDGAQKGAKAVTVYLDGAPEPVEVASNALKGSIRTKVPLRFGSRHPAAGNHNPLGGGTAAVQDFRFYRRALAAGEVRSLSEGAMVRAVLALPADQRQPKQMESLFQHYLAGADAPTRELNARLAGLEQEQSALRARGSVCLVMEERKDRKPEARLLERGQYDKPGETVGAGTPKVLPPLADGQPADRLGLARWLVDARNPLTARVTVNRFWHQFFGTGIVETTEDFGITGARPSHPELLDWLAVEFMENGWDMRKMVRLLVTSSVYRQSARVMPAALEKDPRNRLLARGPRLRLDAEPLRDLALFTSGLLVEKVGGPSVKPYQPDGVWEAVAMPQSNTKNYKPDEGEALYRRSLYTFWKRTAPHPAMELFNAPSREVFCTRRERTNTPLQALVLLNDPQFVEAVRVLAERVLAGSTDEATRMDDLALRLLARPLRGEEKKILGDSLAAFREAYAKKPEAAKQLVTVGTRPPAPGIPPAELAAWTLVASQVLNMDECVTK